MGFMFVNFDFWPWMARRSCLFGTIVVYFDSNLEGGWKKDEKSASRLYTSHQACPVLQIQKCFYPGLNSIHWVEAVWWSSIPMGMKRYGLSDDRWLSSSAVGCFDCSNGDRDGPFTGSCNKNKAHWNVVLSLDTCNYFDWPWLSLWTTCWSANSTSTTIPMIRVYIGMELACSNIRNWVPTAHAGLNYKAPWLPATVSSCFSTQGFE